jgi:LysR family hydrogen peroxide-inducible transcriptional activator
MDRADLELVVTLSEVGSLTAAAGSLHVAQPALSRRLRNLETEVGAPLFERGRRGASPTPVGRLLATEAADILGRWQGALDAVESAVAGRLGRIRLGVTPTLGADLLPPVLARLHRGTPDLRIELEASGDSRALRNGVANGELDMAVAVLAADREAGTRVARVGEQSITLVMPADHRFASMDAVPRRALIGQALVALRAGEGLRELLDEIFDELGDAPDVAIETSEREMLLPFVAAGLGVTLVPVEFARQRIRPGLVSRALTPRIRRRIGVVVRPGALSAAARRVLDAIDEEGVLAAV